MLKRGDIPNAVLLFEAAVQKSPEHTQVGFYVNKLVAQVDPERLDMGSWASLIWFTRSDAFL